MELLHPFCGVERTGREVLTQKDNQEGCDHVVDALHIARGRVPERPDVEHALQRTLDQRALEYDRGRRGARHVNQDLVESLALILGTLRVRDVEVLRDRF
eukprot:scaffold12959_cov116-Isochrysis_galbana.AAC.19